MPENMTQKELDFKRVANIFYDAYKVLNNEENKKLILELNYKYSEDLRIPINERVIEDIRIDLLRLYDRFLPYGSK